MLSLFKGRMACVLSVSRSLRPIHLLGSSTWGTFNQSKPVGCTASKSYNGGSTFEESYRKRYEEYTGKSWKKSQTEMSSVETKVRSIPHQSAQEKSSSLQQKLDFYGRSEQPLAKHDAVDAGGESLTEGDILNDLNQIRGVGPKKARDILNQYGHKAMQILNGSSADAIKMLIEVPGIGAKTAKSIKDSWDEQEPIREMTSYLRGLGLDSETSTLFVKKQWPDWRHRLESDPYCTLLDANPLVSLQIMDTFVRRMQGSEELPVTDSRVKAALICELVTAHENYQQTCLPWKKLSSSAAVALLKQDTQDTEFYNRMMRCAVELSKESFQTSPGFVIYDPTSDNGDQKGVLNESCLCYLRPQSEDEDAIAHSIIQFVLQGSRRNLGVKKKAALNSTRMQKLSPGQQKAYNILSRSSIVIITGWPGSGKTFFLQSAVTLLQASLQKGAKFALCTPTGRSASKLAEQIEVPCKTIHRLLEVNWSPFSSSFSRKRQPFYYNEYKRLFLHFLGVDEASMIDGNIFSSLLKALQPYKTRLCIVGDCHQLPSVSSGQVLQDIIASKVVPVVDLRQIFRQAKGSMIIDQAHTLLKGQEPDFEVVSLGSFQDFPRRLGSECVFVPVTKGEKMAQRLQSTVLSIISKIAQPENVQVLCASRRGIAGTVGLNPKLQDIFNPKNPRTQESLLEMHEHGQIPLRKGDKVLHCKNDYKRNVFNGDIGVVNEVSYNRVRVKFPGRRDLVDYSIASVKQNLQPAWALTVHKAQGSEYSIVVFALSPGTNMSKEMLYTAITRAKEHLVLVGNVADLKACMKRTSAARFTGLRQKLEQLRKKHQLPLVEGVVID